MAIENIYRIRLYTHIKCLLYFQLSFSSSSGGWAGAKLAGLLVIVLVVAGALLITCGAVAYYGGGINTFAFMSVEVSCDFTLLMVKQSPSLMIHII